MERIYDTALIPAKMWIKDIEEAAYIQMKNLANFPYIFPHLAFMPDAHAGYGIPIGSVIPTKEVLLPSAVGVDIGCGMLVARTNFKTIKEKRLKKIISQLNADLQKDFRTSSTADYLVEMPEADSSLKLVNQYLKMAKKQLGTLGGGNHFIEIQKGEDGFVWIMLHSGSRQLGKQVADHYILKAEAYARSKSIGGRAASKLPYLPLDSEDGQAYLAEMNFCMEYAHANRLCLLERVRISFEKVMGGSTSFNPPIDLPHNFAAMESHFGEQLMVHRKGATRAFNGELGIIPGSMGTSSFIVKGLGNPDSLMSCSHGAGRKMGRNEARKKLDLDFEKKRLDKQKIIHQLKIKDDLEEATGAYKNIHQVMKLQQDLVEVVMELKPMAVVKM